MIKLVRATVKDAATIAQTRYLVWQQTYRGIYPDDKLDAYDFDAYAKKDFNLLSDPANHYYLFMDGEKCVGYFSFGPYHYGKYKDFDLCINHLYIVDGYKGRGLGRRAFQEIMEACRQAGYRKYFCGCNASNLSGISFYRHMGGIEGDQPDLTLPKEDQIIHFEFYLGE